MSIWDIDEPSMVEYYENGKISYEKWTFDRENDLPNIINYYENGNIKQEIWKNKRENDLPSYIYYYEDGNVYKEFWNYQRENDLPSEIYYYVNGNICKEGWNYIRDNDLPNDISYYENGNIKSIYYRDMYNGGYRKYNTKYDVQYYENGNVKHESWHNREFGPLYVHYNEDGSIKAEWDFKWDSKDVSKEEYYRLKDILDLEAELEDTIPVNNNHNVSKVVKF